MRQKQCIRFGETAVGFIFSRPRSLVQPATEPEANCRNFVFLDFLKNEEWAWLRLIHACMFLYRSACPPVTNKTVKSAVR